MRLLSSLPRAVPFAWYALGTLSSGQLPGVAVDPHFVVLSARAPAGKVVVFNPKASAVEVTIQLRYGILTTDANGTPAVRLSDSTDTTSINSAHRWITPYPKTFILNPGQSQAVRLLAKPPTKIADGEYWARLVVHARELAPILPPRATTDSTLRLGVSIETSTILPVFFRTGQLATGIQIDTLSAHHTGDSLAIHATLTRTGNAAYIGVAHIVVRDAGGAIIADTRKRVAVYGSITPIWRLPWPPTRPLGTYRVSVVLSTERPDAPPGMIVRSPAKGRDIEVTL